MSQGAIDYFSVGTPITNEHYLNAKEGAIYGLEHGIERFSPKQASLLRPESGIEGMYNDDAFFTCHRFSKKSNPHLVFSANCFAGLFLSGQDVMCSGFVPSMMSGLLCASAILKTNLFNDLVLLHKKVKAAGTLESQRSKRD